MALTEIIIKLVDRASKELDTIGNIAEKNFSRVASSADIASSAEDEVASSASGIQKVINSINGDAIENIAPSGDIAANGLHKVGAAATEASTVAGSAAQHISTMFSSAGNVVSGAFTKMKSVAVSAGQSIRSSLQAAADKADGLSGAITGVISGFGLMTIVGNAWGGSTQRQFNEAYLSTVMTKNETKKYLDIISQIVAAVPGDDTYMNALLTGALARQSSLTTDQLKLLGEAASRYITISSQTMGGITAEYEREIKDYILTGNTGLMERDGLLKNQMGVMKGQETVEDRIVALNQALTNEGYQQIDLNSLASTKWEEIKGKIQSATTEIGSRFLPYIQSALEWFIDLDTKTGGWSSNLVVIAGVGVAIAASIGLIAGPLGSAIDGVNNLQRGIRGVESASGKMGTIGNFFNTIGSKAKDAASGVYQFIASRYAESTANSTANATENTSILTKARSTISTVAHTVAESARAGVLWLVSAAQTALNAVMSANPIAIVILAIVGLIALLALLYNRNETVRKAVDWLWKSLQQLGAYIMGGLMSAWNAIAPAIQPVIDAVMALWHWITGNSPGLIPALTELGELVFNVFGLIFQTVAGVIGAIIGHFMRVFGILTELIAGNISFSQAIQMIWGSMKVMLIGILQNILAGIGGWIINLTVQATQAGLGFVTNLLMFYITLPARVAVYLSYVIQRGITFANQLWAKAQEAGRRFVSGLIQMISQAPGKVGSELMRIVDKIMSFGGELYNKAKDLGNRIKDGLMNALGIASPGYMFYAISDEMDRIEDKLTSSQDVLGGTAGDLGDAIVAGMGTPQVSGEVNLNAPDATSTVLMGNTVTNTLTRMGTTVSQSMGAMVQTTTSSLASMNNNTLSAYESMRNTTQSAYTTLTETNKTAFNSIIQTTAGGLANVRSATVKEVGNVRNSWSGMQNALVESASTIRGRVTSEISRLTSNMATFWHRISNPSRLVAGGYAGHPSLSRGGGYAGPSLNPFDDDELMRLFPQMDCRHGCYAGGWTYSTPWVNSANDSIYKWTPSFGSYGSLGLTVGDFKSTSFPMKGSMRLFELLAEQLIGPTGYDFYYNGRYSNAEALARGRFNCWDGAEILVSLAQALGIPARMIHGQWGNVGHMAALVNGVIFDTTQRQNRGVWRGSQGVSFGPGHGGAGEDSDIKELNLNLLVDLKNVPSGNSDETIADMVADSVKERKVLTAIKEGLGMTVNRVKRARGV
jgi:phage-related protein